MTIRAAIKQACLSAAVMAVLSGSASALAQSDLNAITYDKAKWSPMLVEQIAKGPAYLPRDMDLKLAPPPANDSPETRADLDAMLEMQTNQRTPENVKLILEEHLISEVGEEPPLLERIGFESETMPKTRKFIDAYINEVNFFILREKQTINRARPTQLEPKLTTVVEIPPHPAYPSGHAGQNYIIALALAELDPAHKEKYIEIAKQVASRREIAGVHYHGDSVAGFYVAEQVAGKLKDVPDIQALKKDASAEFDGSKLKHASKE